MWRDGLRLLFFLRPAAVSLLTVRTAGTTVSPATAAGDGAATDVPESAHHISVAATTRTARSKRSALRSPEVISMRGNDMMRE